MGVIISELSHLFDYNFFMKIFLIILIALISNGFAGTILSMRGEVYGQLNSKGEKFKLVKGKSVNYNTLVSTGKRSFVKVRFDDKSIFTVGPNSKMVLTGRDNNSPKVLHLLMGQIKAHIKKNQKIPKGHNHKLYIKTKSAVMGIRGTEFVVSYNNKNHNTSNITLSGEVDMVKRSDEEILDSIRETDVDEMNAEIEDYDETIDLKDKLESFQVKSIKKGAFSSAMLNHDSALEPVRIAAVQIKALKRSKAQYANNDRRPQTKDGIRHGGYVDLKSGLYVAPPENAKFDNKTGVYQMPEELGKIDLTTGEYLAPKGMSLDPISGFVADPKYYGDRNIMQNLKKITTLAGPIDEQLGQALRIFKHITRTDFYGFGEFKHTSNALENYYGEYRNISDTPAYFLEAQGFGGMQLYHSKKYLLYLKGHMKGQYFDSDEKLANRNTAVEGMGGLEFHRKLSMYGKKASLVFDIEYRKQYLNREMDGRLLPYTDDVSFRVKQVFSFNKNNHSSLFYQIKYFQGFNTRNHGKVDHFGFHHRLVWGKEYDVLAGADYSARHDNIDEQVYRISRMHLKGVRKDFLYKTDLTFGLTHEWHETDLEIPFDKAIFQRAQLLLKRRLGNFWKFNINYTYEDQKADNDVDNRSFNRHIFGLGLTMYF